MAYTEHRSTARVLQILQVLAKNKEGYTLSKLAGILEAPKGSIFPILQTMKENRFLGYNEKTGIYKIGSVAFQVGMSFVNSGDGLKYVERKISDATAQCLETTHFAILDNGNVVYLLKKDSPQAIRMIATVGLSLPAYATGIGKALLLDYTLEELKTIYPQGLSPMTNNTITDFGKLYQQLQAFRGDDITYEYEESNKDVQCVATPIRREGKIIAALSVAIPIFRCDDNKLKEIRSILIGTKKVLEEYFEQSGFDLK